ncbi:chemotaxis protein CheB [Rhizobium dioscoreae]|uniref:chemotaxis protein CheB n=1 Tax=Rhizobium dioscoreae TaxID=2653122 RepID=UPI001260E6D4|nr:chemotaxis protein CheB [Rhizobium dioscoreae]GES45887.1 chemotaxis protein CheB [Rhizobium dioscoreae]
MSGRYEAVVIGASAGGVEALSVILPFIPETFSLPIVVVVHVPPDRRSIMADLFRAKCVLSVTEAEDKQPLVGGTIYFAPPDYHLLIETEGSLALSNEEPILFSRPSIDVLFESAADAYGSRLIAIVLTGANTDGAKGLRAVVDAGGTAIVQNPDNATAAAMPMAAISMVPEAYIMQLSAIREFLGKI